MILRSISLDQINDKLYVVNMGDRSVSVVDLDGKKKATLFQNDTLIPYEVAVDSTAGLMFILAANLKLEVMQVNIYENKI